MKGIAFAARLLPMYTKIADKSTPPTKQLTQISAIAQTGSVWQTGYVRDEVGVFEFRTQIVPV